MYDLIVIGGGPAGTGAAITAARTNARVLLLERGRFPRHKVCGEFVSAESLQLLTSLLRGCDEGEQLLQRALAISMAHLFVDDAEAQVRIDTPAASIARYDLDCALWRAAELAHADCRQQVDVVSCHWSAATGQFELMTSIGTITAKSVIDASGRWSKLRQPSSTQTQSHRDIGAWLGLKAHFAEESGREPSVDLYFFEGGYCGVQPVGAGRVNACAMVRADVASRLGEVFELHPRLSKRANGWTQLTDAVATSPLIFLEPTPERDGVLCAGDAAAFIDPFAGDGISLALRSGTAAADCLDEFWRGAISLRGAAGRYREEYARRFAPAFRAAARVRRILQMPRIVRQVALRALQAPAVAEYVIKATR